MTESDSDPIAALEPEELEVAQQLSRLRPVPKAGFRGALARHLAARDPGYGPRPERLRPMIAGHVSTGSILVVLGALVATGQL